MSNLIQTGDIVIGRGSPLVLVSGPCVIEDYECCDLFYQIDVFFLTVNLFWLLLILIHTTIL